MVNTYAWINDTRTSRPYIAVIASTDTGLITAMAAKPANTLITAWPAITLPARRIEWLTGRTKYEMISMMASTGRSARGALETQKSPRNFAPFFTNQTIVTVRNTSIARTTVTAKCDVGVKDIGRRPRKFENTMNINSVMM